MAQIECKNISVGYNGNDVIKNLSFEINKGDYLCIVGENGSGKSTLMKTIVGLQKQNKGKIIFGEGLKQNKIGYLPQQSTLNKDFPALVKEIVISGCLAHMGFKPFYTKKERNISIENMKKLEILDFKDKSFKELSGGQQQRVLLARALCATEDILFLDEPVSGLDPKATKEMYSIIKKLNKEENITIVMISHDINESLKFASNVLYIGKHKFFGTKEEFVASSIYNSGLNLIGGAGL